MERTAKTILLSLLVLLIGAPAFSQRISFDMLQGTWDVKESRDLKVYSKDKLEFNAINARCYMKSSWTFDSDSTGFVSIKSSDLCPQATTMKFKYRLFEGPGYGGPSYKMGVTFENGYTDQMVIQSDDGQKKLKLAYNQLFTESMATNDRVWIYYSLKKKS